MADSDEIIPAADLPVVTPGAGDYVVGVQLGNNRRFRADSLPASAPMQAAVDAAEAARDAAQAAGNIYTDTTTGLDATSGTGATNRYFSVPSADSDEYLILYRNDAGVATEVKTYPSASLVTALQTQVDSLIDGEAYGVVLSNDSGLASGGYPASRSVTRSQTMTRLYAEVLAGTSAMVAVRVNGYLMYGPSPVTTSVSDTVNIPLVAGDTVDFEFSFTSVTRMWAQIDGGAA